VLTGYTAALALRSSFWEYPHHVHWIFDNLLPPRAVLVVNVALYACMLYLCIALPLTLLGKERVLVVAWVPGVLLSPIQAMVSAPLAAAIQYVKAISIIVAFVTALVILLEGPANANARSDGPALE
jgi:hypothetical protein